MVVILASAAVAVASCGTVEAMGTPIRVMVERGRKKRVVACAFDWSGWDRSAKTEADALSVLAAYRPRYAKVAALADLGDAFDDALELTVVERLEGNGMTDYYGVSGKPATPELDAMSAAECDRKIALLHAAWTTFDSAAGRVSAELRKGPRGGGRDRDRIVRHVNGAEIDEFAPKVGIRTPLEARDDPEALRAHREAFAAAIRETNARGAAAGSWWTVQFLIRRCAWHMLDHAWELEDRDLSGGT
jgi:hypothetical protein